MREAILSTANKSEVIIRRATEWDITNVLTLVALWIEEAAHSFIGNVCPSTGVYAAECIRSKLVLLAECEKEIIGILILKENIQPWDENVRFIVDEIFFVRKEYRASNAARLLLSKYKQILDDSGMSGILIMDNGTDMARKDKFMQRYGFKRVGCSYSYGEI